jgi:Transcriptional regulatory protein, C terminal/FHA domain
MESAAEVVVSGPGLSPTRVPLSRERATVGRLPGENDIALEPDPERLVTRVAHCTFERDGNRWFVVDGGSINGTFVGRGSDRHRVVGRTALRDGDVVSILASVSESGERRYFDLAFHAGRDSQATRAAPLDRASTAVDCLRYEIGAARLVLVRGDDEHEIAIRAQAHRLVRHMVERNAAAGGSAVLCTHDELMRAVWADEPMHTREELAKLVWELRKKLEPFGAEQLIENERRLGYRIHTCR